LTGGTAVTFPSTPPRRKITAAIAPALAFIALIAPSFLDFLKLVAAAPLQDDDPDFDPLAGAGAS
jgi:hypothetical protein